MLIIKKYTLQESLQFATNFNYEKKFIGNL